MPEPQYSYAELSTALHEAVTPHMAARGFSFEDTPSDDPIYQLGWDLPRSRRYYRSSKLGFDYFTCRFIQYSTSDSHTKSLGIGIEAGVHVEAIENLEFEIASSFMNPRRIGMRLPHVFHIKDDLDRLRQVNESASTAERLMRLVDSEGEHFWSKHVTLDSIQQHFDGLSVRERHSPRGAPYASRPLMLIAFLKRDRPLFDRIVHEYSKHISMDIYRTHFDHLVNEIQKKFNDESNG